jgi:small conductance mechanosensitive channel
MEEIKNFEFYLNKYGQELIDFLPTLLTALVILFVGLWIVKMINKVIRKFFQKKDYDPTLENFIASLINWGLKILLFVIVVNQLGVESASLVAIIGAAGLAVGLALQGSLANFAGGVLILLLKPFKVDDFISAQGVDGTVKEISIFTTKLLTIGNQLAVIPNGKLSNETIINYTEEGFRREALTFGISYNSDVKTAKDILLALANEQEATFKDEDHAPQVVVTELADSAVNLSLRYWTDNDDFWATRFYTLEEGKKRLEAAGIEIPFPQRDVHLYNNN